MNKVNLELSEKEFNVLTELLAVVTINSYRKAIGDKVIIAAEISFSKETDEVLKGIDRKLNP